MILARESQRVRSAVWGRRSGFMVEASEADSIVLDCWQMLSNPLVLHGQSRWIID